MRVGVYYRNDDVRVEERPVPEIGPGELLVKVWASGICGSDVMEWYRINRAPLVLGHEIGHVTARHTAQRYSAAMATNIGRPFPRLPGAISLDPRGVPGF